MKKLFNRLFGIKHQPKSYDSIRIDDLEKEIGRLNGVKKEDIYGVMLLLNDGDQKITIAKLADSLGVTSRTIHRHMCNELKQVKEELNEEINI